jgi:hypothetical protein
MTLLTTPTHNDIPAARATPSRQVAGSTAL